MQLRITQKLGKKIKMIPSCEPEDQINPYQDWVARLFRLNRSEFIMITNRLSLFTTVILGKGIRNEKILIERSFEAVQWCLSEYGFDSIFEEEIKSSFDSSYTCKVGDRRVNGSMNDLIMQAEYNAEFFGVFEPEEITINSNQIIQVKLEEGFPPKEFATLKEQYKHLKFNKALERNSYSLRGPEYL